MSSALLAVFAMGLRHGADPDHLAVIDNLTRNANDRMPRASRFVGTFFAFGHSGMVLLSATLAAVIGSKIGHISGVFTRIAEIASILMLLLMAAFNLLMLARGRSGTFRGKLLPPALTNATHPLIAIPIGALFGLGFETASQLVTYGVAFSSGQWLSGVAVGAAFCGGMICTDTFDSLLVARVVSARTADALRARRMWIGVVTLIALAVAAQEIAHILGVGPMLDEMTLSAVVVGVLLTAASVIALRCRPHSAGNVPS